MNNEDSQYLISLTSVPRRLERAIFITIDNLKKQDVNYKILINIPKKYKKWGDFNIKEDFFSNDPRVVVYRPTKDYGPATKLLGALEYINEFNNKEIKKIITVDDDTIFRNSDNISTLVESEKKYKNCAITYGGIKLVKYPYQCQNGLTYDNIGSVDCPAGGNGVLYPIDKMKKNDIVFNFMKELPEGIFNDDDAYFAIVLSLLDIEIVALRRRGDNIKTDYSGGSAVEEKTTLNRIKNEMIIYQHAVKNNLLPNKNKNY